MTLPKQLSLDAIRSSLIRQEETIIFALIERAQFKRNTATCEPGHAAFASVLRPSARTFLDHMLLEHERLHATVRRYASPEEHAFFPSRLPAPSLQQLPSSGGVLVPNGINVNEQIRALYESTIIPSICAEGDDEQYGSATLCDIAALQAISKRVHYGKFVAESKFRSQTAEYTALIRARDAAGLMALLTNSAVEERLLRRVRAKASTYGQDIEDPTSAPAPPAAGAGVASPKVDPETIVALYRDHVIPLTKEVEVLYLLQRLEGCHVACADGRARRAADAHFAGAPRAALHFSPAPSVAAVMSAVLCGKAQYGVLPLEAAASTLDVPTVHALSVSALRVCADVLLHDPPLVLAARGAAAAAGGAAAAGPASALATVHGPMAALHEASEWLAEVAPDALLQTLPALADLRAFADGLDARAAVLCTRAEAEAAGLVLVDCAAPSATRAPSRFLIVSLTEQAMATGSDRSMLFFKVEHASGALARVLAVFTSYSVNLENIHPYADPDGGARACFFVECSGHASEPHLAQALDKLREVTSELRCLGSFVSAAAPMS